MTESIEYLLKIRKVAGDVYKKAAVFFKKDKEFARFLTLLAEDERGHIDALLDAVEQLKHLAGYGDKDANFIAFDAVTKDEIERPLLETKEKLLGKVLTKKAMISCIVAIELAEWNHVFLYLLNTLRHSTLEFQRLAAMVERHKKRIEAFLESLPDSQEELEQVRRLPSVWRPRILIVDDDAEILLLLSIVLAKEADPETAENGEEALLRTSRRYFDLIISDVNMPVMDGIEFYKEAAKADKSIRERFLFLTGLPTDENIAFFTKNQLKYMEKPRRLYDVRPAVHDIMMRRSPHA